MKEKKLSIFLAEDDPDDRIFFVKALKSVTENFELKIFDDGKKFVECFQSDHPHPDFVFLNISLPR